MPFDAGEILLTILRNFANLIPVRVIHSYEQGVRFSRGKDTSLIKKPGIYGYVPFIQELEIFDTRYDSIDIANSSIETRDGISMTLSGTFGYRIINARKCVTQVGNCVEVERHLERIARGVLSSEARKYSQDQIKNRKPLESQDSIIQSQTLSIAVGAENYKNEKYEEENDEDIEEESDEDLILRGNTSELEDAVTFGLQKRARKWGVKTFPFSLTDNLKTRGHRFFGDISTITDY